MNFDESKENIQPLASGRNIEQLEAALSAESQDAKHQLLLEHREKHEINIRNYCGNDPLGPWYEYILWLEQSYPKSGKESGIDEIVEKCLTTFEEVDQYKQDPRMIKLYIKYIDSQPNPQENYQILYNNGIGTRCADLYIGWAYYYDVCNNFEKAEEIYTKGLDAHAEPREALELAHVQFGFSMSRRLLHKDESHQKEFLSTMEERRYALTSLRSHKHRDIGSIRTGQAIKSYTPGLLKQDNHGHGKSNAKVSVYNENQNPNFANEPMAPPPPPATVHSILSTASKQENKREPGPWSEAKKGSKQNLFNHTINNAVDMRFSILEDSDNDLPAIDAGTQEEQQRIRNGLINKKSFPARSAPQTKFDIEICIDEPPKIDVFPTYDKIMCYPFKNIVFSPEELRAYKWFKKNKIDNKFSLAQDKVWGSTPDLGIRLPPQFSRKNDPQTEFKVKPADDIRVFPKNTKLAVHLNRLLPPGTNEDVSIEELLKEKWLKGELPSQKNNLPSNDSMEETVFFDGRRQSIYKEIRRKTVFNSNRKSIIPPVMNEDNNSPTLTKENFEILVPGFVDQPTSKVLSIFAPALTNATKVNADEPKLPLQSDKQPKKSTLKLPPPAAQNADDPVAEDPLKNTGAIRKTEFKINEDPDLFEKPAELPKPRKSILKAPSIFKEPEEPMEEDLRYTGAIRKSIPIKRKSTKTVLQNYENFNVPPPESTPTNTDAVRFEIFEDPTVNTANSPAAKTLKITSDVFKMPTPAITINNEQCQPINDNENNAKIEEENQFLPNDSCTTQHFNFFIKPQSISTPVSKRKTIKINEPEVTNGSGADTENVEPENISPATVVGCSTSVDDISPSTTPDAPKQLYTIMETTEPTTKSSVDVHNSSSPEDQISKSKNFGNDKTSPEGTYFGLSTMQPSKEKPFQVFSDHQETHQTNVEPMAIFHDTMKSDSKSQFPELGRQSILNPVKLFIEPKNVLPSKNESKTTDTELLASNFKSNLTVECNNGPIRKSAFSFRKTVFDECKTDPKIKHDKPIEKENNKVSMIIEPQFEMASEIPDVKMEKCANIEIYEDQNISKQFESITIKPKSVFQIYTEETIPSLCPNTIFDDKTETIPKMMFPKQISQIQDKSLNILPQMIPMKLNEECEQPSISINSKLNVKKAAEELCDVFTTTPVKQKLKFPVTKSESLIDEHKPSQSNQHFSATNNNKNASILPSFTTDCSILDKSNKKQLPVESEIPVPRFTCNAKEYTNSAQSLLEPLLYNLSNLESNFEIEPSIHIKQEPLSDVETFEFRKPFGLKTEKKCEDNQIPSNSKCLETELSYSIKENELKLILELDSAKTISDEQFAKMTTSTEFNGNKMFEPNIEDSIYVQRDPIEFSIDKHGNWDVSSEVSSDGSEKYQLKNINSNETNNFIENVLIDKNVDPLDSNLHEAFLDRIGFTDYLINDLPECTMISKLAPLRPKRTIDFGEHNFEIITLIGEGSFGSIFSALNKNNGRMYAIKQERPANLWEYYICLEIQSRIQFPEILKGFMVIDYSIIANNASLLVTSYSKYGSMLDVCNKFKKVTNRNFNENIVMVFASQMLLIVDHLHASNIIHADIKPDNFLLMNRPTYDTNNLCIKLIDFGQSIDMKLFPPKQTFSTKILTENFTCTEMIDGRPWTYQHDLFCLAATVYTMLFGRYMRLQKKITGYTMCSTIPRYLNKSLWETFFDTLINIRDCTTMPNLQTLRDNIKVHTINSEKIVCEKIAEFNRVIDQKL